MMRSQSGLGLNFVSELPIPGAIAVDQEGDAAPIPVLLENPRIMSGDGEFARDGDNIVYGHSTGRFRCSTSCISIAPGDPPNLEDLGALLVANALPALLWQRGAFMLHAAGLRLHHGPVIAIAGARGSGKSRLAAACVAAGAGLIGDDSLSLQVGDSGVVAAGLPGGWFDRTPGKAGRTFLPVPPGQALGPRRLNLVVFLDGVERDPTPLSRPAALELLLRHRHRPQVPQLLRREGDVLRQAASIASAVPAVTISPEGLSDDGGIREIEALNRLARKDIRDSRDA